MLVDFALKSEFKMHLTIMRRQNAFTIMYMTNVLPCQNGMQTTIPTI